MEARADEAERLAARLSRDYEEKGMRKAEVSKLIAATVVAGVVGVGAAVLAAALALTMAARQAEATPQFAAQTKLPCGQCHASPAGGGKLKPFGERFRAKGNKL